MTRTLTPALLLVSVLALPGCAVTTVAGAVVGAAVSVTGAVVSTGVTLTGKAVGAVIDAASGSSDEPEDKKPQATPAAADAPNATEADTQGAPRGPRRR